MYKKAIINKFLIILPFLDLITSLTVRFFPSQTSLGVIIKGLYLLYLFIYLIFNNYSKYKKVSIVYLLLLLLYEIIYFVTKIDYLTYPNLLLELKGQLKFLFFPITLISLTCFYDQFKFSKKEITRILSISIVTYIAMLLIPTITCTGFVNTTINSLSGHIGWFYSSNEVLIILIMLYPFIYRFSGRIKNILFYLLSFIVLLIIYSIGTKFSFFVIIIVNLLMLIINIYKKEKNTIFNYFIVLLLTTTIGLSGSLFSGVNIFNRVNNNQNNEEEKLSGEKTEELKILLNENPVYNFYYKYGQSLLKDKNINFENTLYSYVKNYNVNTFLVGLGLTNENGYNKLIEIDILDLFFYYGFLAVLIYLVPIIYLVYFFIKDKKTSDGLLYFMMISLGYLISISFGHVLMAPAVSIYLAFYFILFFDECGWFKKKQVNKNELSIYVLHLNYGGVERSVTNLANILSEKYTIKIYSVYNLCEPAFKLNDNIQVEYLNGNLKPNRSEFKEALRGKKFIKAFIAGLQSVKILYLKHVSLCRSLTNCNSEIIISTRIEFSKKLVKYNAYDNIKIAHEHVYHNHNIFYLNNIRKILKHIDYLMPCSEYLTEYYKTLYPDYSDKIIQNMIPVDINGIPNKLDNKNIISVGRLSPEKGFVDLIKVFKLVSDKHPDWLLTVVGNGSEMGKIKKLIKKYKLQSKVILTGKVNHDNLIKLYEKSSIYVMPSYEESFGLVLIEAANFNLPLVATGSALGAREIIGENGIIIENRNLENMANEINKLIDDYSYRCNMGEKSKLVAKKYDYSFIEKELLSFYDNVGKYSIYSNLYRGTLKDFRKLVKKRLEKREKTFIVTANSETFLLTKKDNVINKIVNDKNNLIVPDGISVVKTANYLDIDIKERITGVDSVGYLLETANKYRYSIYLFGSTEDVIKAACQNIKRNYPNVKLLGYENGYVKDKDVVMDRIKVLKPDIVLVALGVPLQEKLINKHIKDFEKGIFMGVGGSFDVISGYKKRAPKLFIKLNLEWLYRILSEPKRIIRFLKYNIVFLFHINREKKQ